MQEAQPDEVYNLAAQSFVPTSLTQPVLTGEFTALGVTRILEAVRLVCPDGALLPGQLVGDVRQGAARRRSARRTPFYPRSPYGVAKVYGHWITVNYRESYGLYAVSGILFNHESPRRGIEFVTRKVTDARGAHQARARDRAAAGQPRRASATGASPATTSTRCGGCCSSADAAGLRRRHRRDAPRAGAGARSPSRTSGSTGRSTWWSIRSSIRPAEVDLLHRRSVARPGRELGWKPTVSFEELVQMMVDADLERLAARVKRLSSPAPTASSGAGWCARHAGRRSSRSSRRSSRRGCRPARWRPASGAAAGRGRPRRPARLRGRRAAGGDAAPMRWCTSPRWPPGAAARRDPGRGLGGERGGNGAACSTLVRRRDSADRGSCFVSRPARCTGAGTPGRSRETDAARDPCSPYAASKVGAECGARGRRGAPGSRSSSRAPFRTPARARPPTYVVPALAARLQRGEADRRARRSRPAISEPVRDFLDVRDVVRRLPAAARARRARRDLQRRQRRRASTRATASTCWPRLIGVRCARRAGCGAAARPAIFRVLVGDADQAPRRDRLGARDSFRTDAPGPGGCPSGLTSRSILLIGSGPIVIGQGAEFDYSGTQAVRALKEEGYRVILVNSNPATIMTDPELADRTYIEPVTPEWVAKVIERERPDALLPTMGGQTALNVAMALVTRRHAGEVRRRADRRQRAGHPDGRGPGGVRRRRWRASGWRRRPGRVVRIGRGGARGGRATPAIPRSSGRRSPWAAPAAASPTIARSSRRMLRRGLELSPVRLGAGRAEHHRLEGVRARGDARRRRQRRDRLLDREPRPDGRAHRRLDHRGAGDDAHRSRIPADARRVDQDHPRGRRRGRRLQHPVRRRSGAPASSW